MVLCGFGWEGGYRVGGVWEVGVGSLEVLVWRLREADSSTDVQIDMRADEGFV